MKPYKVAERSLKFAHAYVTNGENMTKAMLALGYKESTAHKQGFRYLRNPDVQQAIVTVKQQYVTQLNKQLTGQAEWKRRKLIRVIEKYIPDSDDQPLRVGEVRTAIAALAELNKIDGSYAPTKVESLNVNTSVEELRAARLQYKEY